MSGRSNTSKPEDIINDDKVQYYTNSIREFTLIPNANLSDVNRQLCHEESMITKQQD